MPPEIGHRERISGLKYGDHLPGCIGLQAWVELTWPKRSVELRDRNAKPCRSTANGSHTDDAGAAAQYPIAKRKVATNTDHLFRNRIISKVKYNNEAVRAARRIEAHPA